MTTLLQLYSKVHAIYVKIQSHHDDDGLVETFHDGHNDVFPSEVAAQINAQRRKVTPFSFLATSNAHGL